MQFTKEKMERIRKRWDEIFQQIINEVLEESFTADEIKEIFCIGVEVYKRKRSILNGANNKKVKM